MNTNASLHLRRLGIDTYKEAIIYMREDCHVCLSEGFEAHARVRVTQGKRTIIATLNTITSDLLEKGKAGLSEYAWKLLAANEGDAIHVSHAKPVHSLSFVRSKIYGNTLSHDEFDTIIKDLTEGRYSDIQISSFLTACAGGRMTLDEITSLTHAMVDVGDKLNWGKEIVVDKHCVGGLPGNRTTPIVVPIVTAFGLTMPKTSSRAITSPAGTADTMEVFTQVEMDVASMQKVVEQENGCLVWGGSVSLSPADDILIRVEKALDLDSEGQLVASVLSKKIAAGSTHILIDIPIGPTAKVRSHEMADLLKTYFEKVSQAFGVEINILFSEGLAPVGKGIGPALEARDVQAVLQNDNDAPKDLRDRALTLAGHMLEFSSEVKQGSGKTLAQEILDSGQAWDKFQAICNAQGGIKTIPSALHTYDYHAKEDGVVIDIDNRRIALLAKLAGAPQDKAAGIALNTSLNSQVKKGNTLFTIHADSPGELNYAVDYLRQGNEFMRIGEK